MMKKRFGAVKSYEDWLEPAVVENALDLLDVEIPRFKNRINMVYLCFTTDPFMYEYDEIRDLSLAIIEKLNNAGIHCSVLTKGILPDKLIEYSKENEYGITLISLNEDYRLKMEPGSAPYAQRIAALRTLHDAGCQTWVSIEPYPTPNLIEQNLGVLLDTIGFVDKIIFGRTNYSKDVSEYKANKEFYNAKAKQVIKFCTDRQKAYHIKKGTITD
jgi:DNA repair photolyase